MLLALTGSAQADVFVPADPPAARTECISAERDLIAIGGRDRDALLSSGGSPFAAIPPVTGCPLVAAADDGTAAVVGTNLVQTHVTVRRPGAGFAPAAELDPGFSALDVAVARGGWAMVVGVARDLDPDADAIAEALTVAIIRPDGAISRTVVDSSHNTTFSDPRAGIGPDGAPTLVWSRSDRRGPTKVRLWRGGAVTDLATLAEPQFGTISHALAVSPGGTTLVAWSATEGVRVSTNGEPPVAVDHTTAAVSLAAAVNDAGASALVYGNERGDVVASERGAAGTWSIPRVLAAGTSEGPVPEYDERGAGHAAAITDDGRAAVVWTSTRSGRGVVFGATGPAGGRWSPASVLSTITRSAGGPSLALDAGGRPRVYWLESGRGTRGAVALPDAAVDRTPPVVTARLPSRTARTASGRFSVAVRVRCSEACDARLGLRGDDYRYEGAVRALAAGRSTTLRFRVSPDTARRLLVRRSARRQRLELLVTDRAGNVVRRTRTLAVRLVHPPLRTFKVGPRHSFAMSTRAGDRAVGRLVNALIEGLAAGTLDRQRALERRFEAGVAAIRRAGHDEIDGDDVRSEIYAALLVPLIRRGLEGEFVYLED